MSYHDYGWRPYVSVATRRRRAAQMVATLQRSGRVISPVTIEGRKIARTFWGESWCRNLEAYSDYVNRLPRGRTYVRNGSVVHLDIRPGQIEAMVSGSSLYRVKISIAPAAKPKWKALCAECAGGNGPWTLCRDIQRCITNAGGSGNDSCHCGVPRFQRAYWQALSSGDNGHEAGTDCRFLHGRPTG